MKKLLLFAFLVALLPIVNTAAWGRLGHAAIAYIAEQHLTPEAKANLDKLLDGKSIVDYASYMDDYRAEMLVDLGYNPTNGKRMHTLPHTFTVDKSDKVMRGNRLPHKKYFENSLYYIEQSTQRLNRQMGKMDDSTRLACIKIIVHCIGDMHCPGHVRYYPDNQGIGQFKVTLNGKELKYHALWDTQIVQALGLKNFTDLAHLLDNYSAEQQQEVTEGNIYDWGREIATVSESIYKVKEGDALGDEFLDEYKPLAAEQLTKAGYRLAKVLNDIFDR
jgi:hypothetical protein